LDRVPELDPVTQEISAQAAEYLAALDAMIEKAEAFAAAVMADDEALASFALTCDDFAAVAGAASGRANDLRDAIGGVAAASVPAGAALGGLDGRLDDLIMLSTATVSELHDVRDAMAGVALASAVMAASTGTAAAAMDAAGNAAGGGGRGLFGAGFWTAAIGGIAVWHIALDLAIEALISVGTAAIAASLGIAALYPVMNDIYDHFMSVYDVSEALGHQIGGIGEAFDQLGRAVSGQGIELLGGALTLVTGQTGILSDAAEHVVTLFDDWMAKIDLWSRDQGTFAQLLHTGASYLQQFGGIIGTVGEAIGNLLRDDPGIARFLLDIVSGAAKLLAAFTSLPGPIVEAVLALHGLYLWGSVLGAAALRWAGWMYDFGKSLIAMSVNPLTWLVVAAAAIAYFGYEATQAQASVKSFTDTMNTALGNDTASRAIVQIGSDLGELNTKINSVNWQSVESGMDLYHQVGTSLGYITDQIGDGLKLLVTPGWSHITEGLSDLGNAMNVIIGGSDQAFSAQAQNNINAYDGEISTLLGSQRNLFHETGNLMSQGYSYTQALGIMDLAGVKAADSFALMNQKVQNLISGYKAMSVQGGILSNSVNAVNLATDIGDSKIAALTGAWTTFFDLVSGGENGLVSFEQAIGTSGTNATGLAAALQTLNGPLTGVSTDSLAAQQAFMSAAGAAQTELNNIMQMVSVAGLGSQGTQMITQATKDMIAQMVPAAKGSSTLTTVLYALAQQGGYLGKDTLPALTQWLGKVADPSRQLQGIIGDLTGDVGNLNTDLKNLSTALGNDLTQAASQAIFYADGGQKAFDNFATALEHTGINSSQTKTTAVQLAGELIKVTGNATLAHKEFDAMAEAMGSSKGQADKLWNSVVTLAGALNKIPSHVNTTIGVTYAITDTPPPYAPGAQIPIGSLLAAKSGHAAGGLVHGPGTSTSDSIHARLSAGEYVMQAAAVSHYGRAIFDAMNARNLASGGPVGITPGPAPSVLAASGSGGGGGGTVAVNLRITNTVDGDTLSTANRTAVLRYNRRNPSTNYALRVR
jgi:hypothetical protein